MKTDGAAETQPLQQEAATDGKPKEDPMVPFFELLRYATTRDKILMFIGGFAAFANGAAFPSFSIIFGDMTDSFSAAGDEMVRQAGMNAM